MEEENEKKQLDGEIKCTHHFSNLIKNIHLNGIFFLVKILAVGWRACFIDLHVFPFLSGESERYIFVHFQHEPRAHSHISINNA